MAWLLLMIAGVCEAGWVIGLKYSEGFTRPWISVLTGIAIAVSMLLLGIAIRTLPIGPAYAIWVAIGIAGSSVGGSWLFEQHLSWMQWLFLGLLGVAVIGLKVSTSST